MRPQLGERLHIACCQSDDEINVERQARVPVNHGSDSARDHVVDPRAVDRCDEELDEARRRRHASTREPERRSAHRTSPGARLPRRPR